VKGPFAPQIPRDFEQMAGLERLAYHSPRQLLAEKFHTSEALLATLNPNMNFDQAGTAITVANVAPMPEKLLLSPVPPKRTTTGPSLGRKSTSPL